MTFSFFMLFRSVLQVFLTQICQTAPLTFRLPGVAAVPAMEYNAVMRFSQPVRRKQYLPHLYLASSTLSPS